LVGSVASNVLMEWNEVEKSPIPQLKSIRNKPVFEIAWYPIVVNKYERMNE
jgi:hypothetical protein